MHNHECAQPDDHECLGQSTKTENNICPVWPTCKFFTCLLKTKPRWVDICMCTLYSSYSSTFTVFKTWDSTCLALIAQMARARDMNPKIGGSSPPQVGTFSVFDTFTRTSFRLSIMNAVARAQLLLQMLTSLQLYLYHQSQYSKTWDSTCLALVAQMVRTFGINPKLVGSSPP